MVQFAEITLRKTFNYIKSRESDLLSMINTIKYEEVVFIACGSSYWLSASASMTFQERTGIKSYTVTSGEVVMNLDYYKKAWRTKK